MATPNYGYEKRQKELAKKQKKAEKLKEKSERKAHGPTGDSSNSEMQETHPVPDSGTEVA